MDVYQPFEVHPLDEVEYGKVFIGQIDDSSLYCLKAYHPGPGGTIHDFVAVLSGDIRGDPGPGLIVPDRVEPYGAVLADCRLKPEYDLGRAGLSRAPDLTLGAITIVQGAAYLCVLNNRDKVLLNLHDGCLGRAGGTMRALYTNSWQLMLKDGDSEICLKSFTADE